MDDIENIQLPEIVTCEDTKSGSIYSEEDASTTSILETSLKHEHSTASTNDKTDEEKVVQNVDNFFNTGVSSPKTTVLGKLKAKQRLQAFLLPKQNALLNFPIKKDDIQITPKIDKGIRKIKKGPIDKAKSIIEELEEIKKVEIAKLVTPTLFKERRSSYREKHYRKKSRSRSAEFVRKLPEKSKYPDSWQEIKGKQLSLEDIRDIKQTKASRNTKYQDNCYDFRKQLLFELPPQPLVSLKIKGISGQDKTVPSPYIRFTKKLPSVSYSISHHKYCGEYLFRSEIYNYIPKPHEDILAKFKAATSKKVLEDIPKKYVRKWYPKQPLSNIIEGCELLEKSLGLSILQSYMDEEEEEEKNEINFDNVSKSGEHQSNQVQSPTENKLISKRQSVNISTMMGDDYNDRLLKKEENNLKNADEKLELDTSHNISKSKHERDKIHKRKKENEPREIRKRKRKKDRQKVKIKKRKKSKNNKSDTKGNDNKTEIKLKKIENVILDKKIDDYEKKNDYKEKENISSDYVIECKKDVDDKNYTKKDRKEFKKEDKNDDRKEYKRSEQKDSKINKKEDKKVYNVKNSVSNLIVPLYYDDFESLRGRSLSKERTTSLKNELPEIMQESSRESVKREYSNKDELKKHRKDSNDREGKIKVSNDTKKREQNELFKNYLGDETKLKLDYKTEKQENKNKEPEILKEENLLKVEHSKPEEGLGTPDTDEYHSHWESDEDVTNVISYSPILPRKLNTSWESEEDISSPDKVVMKNTYAEESSRNRERPIERRSRKYLEGERSLEMPLNIVNLSRKDARISNISLDFSERTFLNNDIRTIYNEHGWKRSEFLKICNDIEGEKLRHERKTLSEERRLLELEKRKLAEKLEKRSFSCDIFENLKDNIPKEVTYEKHHAEVEDVCSNATEYIYDKKEKSRKDIDCETTKKSEHESRKQTHAIGDHKRRIEDDHTVYEENESKKLRYEKIENYVNCEGHKDTLGKIEKNDEKYEHNIKGITSLQDSKNIFKTIEVLDVSKSSKCKQEKWKNEDTSEKYLEKINDINHTQFMSDISDSLNSTRDSLLMSDTKRSNKSDILETEYEEFLKAVTSDISKSENTSKEKRSGQKRQESKTKSKRRRKYSTSSSSSSSDSDDSDSSTSSSSSSSYSSSNSSTSSCEIEKKRRKTKTKHKDKKDQENLVKMEMTHSIIKDLDDLQPFTISKTPIIHIKKEQEDRGYSEVSSGDASASKDIENVIPLPVPSPAIVPPPFINLFPIKQEKTDYSISSKADSTTSPAKKALLIPAKFITPVPRKDVHIATVATSSIILDAPEKKEIVPVKLSDFVESSSLHSSPFFFSIPNKQAVFSESINDSDSQDFTDFFPKKWLSSTYIHEQISNTKMSNDESLTVESTKSVDDKVEEMASKVQTLTKLEETVTKVERSPIFSTIEPTSYLNKEHNDTKIESPQKCLPSLEANLSPKRMHEPLKGHFISKDTDRSSHSEAPRRTVRKSISPKYRNLSPRRFRELSPSYRKSVRYRDDFSSKRCSPRRKRSLERYDKRRSSPSSKTRKNQYFRARTSLSPRRRKSLSPKGRRPSPSKIRRSPSPRSRRSPSPRIRRSPSPRIRRSPSPRIRRSPSPRIRRSPPPKIRKSSLPRNRRSSSPRPRRSNSPVSQRLIQSRNRKSPFRNRSPNRKTSPAGRTYRHNYSRSPSPTHKKESIQQTLQRLAGIEDYHQAINKSPVNSPMDGFKRSVADSTISDDQLLQQNSAESADSPAYRMSTRLIHSPLSPKRVPLDVRINQVLGLDKELKPITSTYTQPTYAQSYTYDQYSEQYGHYQQYNQNCMHKDNYVQSPPVSHTHCHVGSSKVVQIGNMLQVVPTDEISPEEFAKQPSSQKILQVGNMLQIVPTPDVHITKKTALSPQASGFQATQADVPLGVHQSSLIVNQPFPSPVDHNVPTTSTYEKVSPEELMLQKIAERRAERAKRHEERERKRKEKEKRRKEKEKKKQLKLKMKTENMIKKALRIETEALALGETIEDEENATDAMPGCWPSISVISNTPLKSAGKGILITHGFSKLNIEDEHEQKKLKTVTFADGVAPGEGTSPSGGEELSSPPPPKEKRIKKIKKKKLQKKKKIKVKIIRKSSIDSPDDEELDSLPPPSPPPGSPPPHIFPARIKAHTINNIHPTYATGVPLMPVGNYAPQFRPNIPMTVPPPMHNLPHSTHHGPSTPRAASQIVSQHGPPLHGPIPHGVSPGLPPGMSMQGPIHHSSG